MEPPEINQLPPNPHPATKLLTHMRVHGAPIKAERGMTKQELTRAIRYGAHSSAKKKPPLSGPIWQNKHGQAISHSFPSGRSATYPYSGYPPLKPSRNKAENPASFTIYPGVASTKQSPRYPTKRRCVLVKPSTG